MATNPDTYRGCLLGLAVGDALGVTVDRKSYEQICRDYGPAGLLGYDLVNGFAEISSYTQVAAFACNGLLVGVAKGRIAPADCLQNIAQALKEWARAQHLPGAPEKRSCWLYHVKEMRQRKCMDARTLDSLTRELTGSMEQPANQGMGPGTLTAAVAVGMFFLPDRIPVQQIGRLGAQAVALTHGDAMTFLSGAVLAYAIAGILQEPELAMEEQFLQAAAAVKTQFGRRYPQADALEKMVEKTVALAGNPQISRVKAMETIGCDTAAQVLTGAMYAVLAGGGDFDAALITAVNHSGKSAAVGAVTGALLGAKLGESALPEFYLECLPCADVLRELASDLDNSGPKGWRSRLFDDDWDRKYGQGLPVSRQGWAEI